MNTAYVSTGKRAETFWQMNSSPLRRIRKKPHKNPRIHVFMMTENDRHNISGGKGNRGNEYARNPAEHFDQLCDA